MSRTTTTVPYCTVKGFRQALDIAGLVPADAAFDRQVLVERGLSPHAAYPVLGAFRFLGLVDDAGRRTPRLAAFLEPSDLAGRRALVEEAYSLILSGIQLPVDDREVIDRLLVEHHGCALGVAPFCSTFLMWLLAESGLPVTMLAPHRRGRPPAHLAQISGPAREALESARLTRPNYRLGAHGIAHLSSGEPTERFIRRAPPIRRAAPDLA